jgi:two-component system, OmpR family, sensor kinase
MADSLATLERLLSIQATGLKSALEEVAQLLVETFAADKIDALIYDAAIDTLVALGTSDTPMGRRQRALGLDRVPVALGGCTVQVFRSGVPFRSGRVDQEPEELPALAEALGIRSEMLVPLVVAGERRGVLHVSSAEPDFFTEDDLRLLEAVARWVGEVAHRGELVERIAAEAAEHGRRLAADELIAALAHDVGNLLAPLRMRIDLLRRRARRENRQRDLDDADQAAWALERVQRLISDLLDVGRLEGGMFALETAPIDLSSLVRETASAFETPRIEIRVRAPDELTVLSDADRLRQVIENLLSNAVRYSPDGTTVTVDVVPPREHEGPVAVEVVDQGPGIPPELMSRVFERFAHDGSSGGLGLGLYLASRIAAAHGGSLTVTSPPGAGARFRLELPVAGAADAICGVQTENNSSQR